MAPSSSSLLVVLIALAVVPTSESTTTVNKCVHVFQSTLVKTWFEPSVCQFFDAGISPSIYDVNRDLCKSESDLSSITSSGSSSTVAECHAETTAEGCCAKSRQGDGSTQTGACMWTEEEIDMDEVEW